MAREDVWYVYGVVRNGFDLASAPSGLDDAPVELVKNAGVAALASRMPLSAYGPDTIEQNTADVAWLSPRAMAHDLYAALRDLDGRGVATIVAALPAEAGLGAAVADRLRRAAGPRTVEDDHG